MRRNTILVVTVSQGRRSSILKTISSVATVNLGDIDHYIVVPRNQLGDFQTTENTFFIPQPDPDLGLYTTLNRVINDRIAQYEWVTYLNDDDFWLPSFRKLIDTVNQHPQADAIYAKVNFVNTQGNKIAEQTSSPRYTAIKYLYQGDVVLFTQQATLVKSKVFVDQGGFDESYKLIADTDFWIRAIDAGVEFLYLDEPCAAYARHRYQLSNNLPLLEQEKKRLFAQMGSLSEARVLFEKLRFRLYNLKIYAKRAFTYGQIEVLKIIKRLDQNERT
ncbi:MAG: hypothetical protein WBG71_09900 [Leeuwenhoekiella sp.]